MSRKDLLTRCETNNSKLFALYISSTLIGISYSILAPFYPTKVRLSG